MRKTLFQLPLSVAFLVAAGPVSRTCAGAPDEPVPYVKKETWFESMLASREKIMKQQEQTGETPKALKNKLWNVLARDFPDPESRKEMVRERAEKIWKKDWKPGNLSELASRYVNGCFEGKHRKKAARLAEAVESEEDLWKVRAVYHSPPPLRVPGSIALDKDPALQGWWKFDEKSGSKASDSSGNGRTGKLSQGMSFQRNAERGRFGLALEFGGGGEMVEIPGYKGVTGTKPRTVAAWIKTNRARGEIVSWGKRDIGKMWIFGFVRGHVGVVPHGGYLYMNDTVHDGTWHHVAVVVEKVEGEPPNLHDHVDLYLDGAPAAIHDIGLLDLWPLTTGKELDLRIGRGFKGLIDDLRVYGRALSREEINKIFNIKEKSG